jgi:hypothetical protein
MEWKSVRKDLPNKGKRGKKLEKEAAPEAEGV